MRCVVKLVSARCEKKRAFAMKRPVPARAPHARARSVQYTDENTAKQYRVHTRAMRSRRKAVRVWLEWCDGTSATYTQRTTANARSSGEQRRKKLNSRLVWGLSQSGERSRDPASIHPCLPVAARVCGRFRALDNGKLMFSFMFKINQILNKIS